MSPSQIVHGLQAAQQTMPPNRLPRSPPPPMPTHTTSAEVLLAAHLRMQQCKPKPTQAFSSESNGSALQPLTDPHSTLEDSNKSAVWKVGLKHNCSYWSQWYSWHSPGKALARRNKTTQYTLLVALFVFNICPPFFSSDRTAPLFNKWVCWFIF